MSPIDLRLLLKYSWGPSPDQEQARIKEDGAFLICDQKDIRYGRQEQEISALIEAEEAAG